MGGCSEQLPTFSIDRPDFLVSFILGYLKLLFQVAKCLLPKPQQSLLFLRLPRDGDVAEAEQDKGLLTLRQEALRNLEEELGVAKDEGDGSPCDQCEA